MINRSNKIRNRINLTLFIISIFILSGCNDDGNVVVHSARDVSALRWSPKDSLTWNLNQIDSLASYAVQLEIRHGNGYPYQNLGLEISLQKGDTLITKDTLNLYLTNSDGTWKGTGWGSLIQTDAPYKSVRFPYAGDYKLTVRPCMNDWELKGIHAIGVKISKNQ